MMGKIVIMYEPLSYESHIVEKLRELDKKRAARVRAKYQAKHEKPANKKSKNQSSNF